MGEWRDKDTIDKASGWIFVYYLGLDEQYRVSLAYRSMLKKTISWHGLTVKTIHAWMPVEFPYPPCEKPKNGRSRLQIAIEEEYAIRRDKENS